MSRTLLVLLVAGVAGLAGCRESVVGPDPAIPPSLPAPEATQRSLYIKGPDSLNIDGIGHYRAEPLPSEDVGRYAWGSYGNGHVESTPEDPDGLGRLIQVRAIQPGPLTFYVSAFDAGGALLAYGSRTIVIH